MAINDILPFCETNTGTNLESQAAYAADPLRPIGNQPGVASSKFVNKALRQSTYMAHCLAQFLTNVTGDDVLDDATPLSVITTMVMAFKRQPNITKFLSGSGSFTPDPKALYIRVRMVGAGGGGSGSVADGGIGGDTTFYTCIAQGGQGPIGGEASLGVGISGLAFTGANGAYAQYGGDDLGGSGGASAVGGAGIGASGPAIAGSNGQANTGSGGGGAGSNGTLGAYGTGRGGGAGGFCDFIMPSLPGLLYSVGVGGVKGVTTGGGGGNGANGFIEITEYFQ